MTSSPRNVVVIRQPSTPDGVFGDWRSDSDFTCKTVERAWFENATDISCIRPGHGEPPVTYLALWQWSEKHQCNLYHVQDETRVAIEIHAANLAEQLKGCMAPGASIGLFQADSIANGVPEVPTKGVVTSVETLAKLEKDLQDKDGNQMPFYLTIKWA